MSRLDWQRVERDASVPPDSLCSLLGGHFGLVILAHHLIAVGGRPQPRWPGVAYDQLCRHDPLAKPFGKSFAAFGVKLAA